MDARTFLYVAFFIGSSVGRPEPPSAYGAPAAPSPPASSEYGAPADTGYGLPAASGGQVFRHVYVHSAPDDVIEQSNRVIRVPGGGNKHVNIIFVKAPSTSSHQQTEVHLPEHPQSKTVVYVLVKKGSHSADVKVRAPPAPSQPKPEVYFIRYKNKESGGYGAPAAPPPSVSYGAPASVSYGAPAAVSVAAVAPQVEYGAPAAGY